MINTDEVRVWGIHSLNDHLFLKESIIAIGWKEFGDCGKVESSREAFKNHFAASFPITKKGAIPTSAGMLYRFYREMQIGDYIVFPSKVDRKINIGEVIGAYTYEPGADEYVHQRRVKWLKHIPRTAFSQGALYEVGSAMTLFQIKNYAEEYLSALDKNFKASIDNTDTDITVAATAEGIIESTKDFVLKSLSTKLKGYDLEAFVADLLNAMGYRTMLSPRGGDSGIDITAYKDELPPRIVVQVKSQDSDIKEATVQSLRGAMSDGDYGLFVTLTNYTKNAQKFLDKTPIIRGIDGSELVDLILKYYDKLSEKYRKMIPLKMVYIPVTGDQGD